jgi:hypothetical protein
LSYIQKIKYLLIKIETFGGDAIIPNGTDYDIVLEEGLYESKTNIMETIKFLMDNILLWIVISIFCAVWSVMMGDPGSSGLIKYHTNSNMWFIALPITILV